jgi:pimeloyl-ACP methyl ester carboxylesterase
MRDPELGPRVRTRDGVEIATYRFGGEGPPVILLHAAGFHGRGWLPLAPALTKHFSVWSIDQRGHGSSSKAPSGRYDEWSVLVDDLLLVLDHAGIDGWRGVGHSLGGTILLLAEHRRPGTFADLCLYEPVVLRPPSPDNKRPGDNPMSDVTRRRRWWFASTEAARENFASKPPMNRFDPTALDAYVRFGLVANGDGGVVLACTREAEASVYEGASRSGAWDRLGEIRPPVVVLGGSDIEDTVSRVVEDVARRLPRGAAKRMDGLTHFGPYEDPLGVGRLAAKALGARGASGRSTMIVAPPR